LPGSSSRRHDQPATPKPPNGCLAGSGYRARKVGGCTEGRGSGRPLSCLPDSRAAYTRSLRPGPITEDTPESQLPLDYVAAYGPEPRIRYMTAADEKAFDAKQAARVEAWKAQRTPWRSSANRSRGRTSYREDGVKEPRNDADPGPITEDTPESKLPLDYMAAYGPEHKIAT
jgi:hypothetical protein